MSIAEMVVSSADTGLLVTHALGSCLGLSVFDPVAGVGGLLHFMLPSPPRNHPSTLKPAAFYGTTGVPELFRLAYAEGATKDRLIVCAAGGSSLMGDDDLYQIGKRNRVLLRRLFWKNKICLAGHALGGHQARTMTLDLADGRVTVRSCRGEEILWQR